MIKVSKRIPSFQRPLSLSVHGIAKIVNKGLVVPSNTVIAKRLPDGRVQIMLHPDLCKQLGIPPDS